MSEFTAICLIIKEIYCSKQNSRLFSYNGRATSEFEPFSITSETSACNHSKQGRYSFSSVFFKTSSRLSTWHARYEANHTNLD